MLVLEPLTQALARGRIYAEVAGYGLSCDAHHITAAHRSDGAARAMEKRWRIAACNQTRSATLARMVPGPRRMISARLWPSSGSSKRRRIVYRSALSNPCLGIPWALPRLSKRLPAPWPFFLTVFPNDASRGT